MALILEDAAGKQVKIAGVGVPGKDGAPGADGKSAYQAAVDGGYGGTEKEFNGMLANAATKNYVDAEAAKKLSLAGGAMAGPLVAAESAETTAQVHNVSLTATDLEAGVTPLANGEICLVYE